MRPDKYTSGRRTKPKARFIPGMIYRDQKSSARGSGAMSREHATHAPAHSHITHRPQRISNALSPA